MVKGGQQGFPIDFPGVSLAACVLTWAIFTDLFDSNACPSLLLLPVLLTLSPWDAYNSNNQVKREACIFTYVTGQSMFCDVLYEGNVC